jgi:hypothetical protein
MRRVAMVVVLAGLLASCGAEGSVVSKTMAQGHKSGTARAVLLRLLDGDGIGGVRFGQAPEVVAARLGRLFGAPVAPSKSATVIATISARSITRSGTAWARRQTDLNTWNQYANQPLMLATAKGLAVGDPLARGRRLYGRAFVLTTETQGTPPNPRLPRLSRWRASTTRGRIGGGIGITRLVEEGHGRACER